MWRPSTPGVDMTLEAMQVRVWVGLKEGVGGYLQRDGHGTEEAKPSGDGGVAKGGQWLIGNDVVGLIEDWPVVRLGRLA